MFESHKNSHGFDQHAYGVEPEAAREGDAYVPRSCKINTPAEPNDSIGIKIENTNAYLHKYG